MFASSAPALKAVASSDTSDEFREIFTVREVVQAEKMRLTEIESAHKDVRN
jgi:hypothetical protein